MEKDYFPSITVEGYWYSEHHPEYPMPVANVLTTEEANIIYGLIVEKEKIARVVRYKGLSKSRITGERLGCREFITDKWIWPGDFAEHYVLKHRVKPTEAFLDYIGYKDPAKEDGIKGAKMRLYRELKNTYKNGIIGAGITTDEYDTEMITIMIDGEKSPVNIDSKLPQVYDGFNVKYQIIGVVSFQ
jgi:hypothetical protein